MGALLPLAAYREDVANLAGRMPSAIDGELLGIGVILHRCEQVRRAGDDGTVGELRLQCAIALRRAIAALGDEHSIPLPSATEDAAGIVGGLRALAEYAEDEGLLRLADSLLLLAYREFADDAGTLEKGRLLIQRARIARKSGDIEGAATMYRIVHESADAASEPELIVRGEIGLGLLARERGNVPEMRARFEASLLVAEGAGLRELVATAHHGLMMTAGLQKRFGDAVIHAWYAFRETLVEPARSEALVNVGQALIEYGEPETALHVLVAALARKLPRRLELPGLGGCALAAAALGNVALLERVMVRVDRIAGGNDFRYDAVLALADVVDALAMLNDARAEERRSIAIREASAGKFHELVHRLETGRKVTRTPARQEVANATLREVLHDAEEVSNWRELQATL
jgi:hypothetical protein